MPPVHSSPHPINDLNIDWNPKEESMGNPYPNIRGGFEPGYDVDQWAGGENLAGRGRRPMSMPFPMQTDNPTFEHASRFDTGRGPPRRSDTHHQHTNRNPPPRTHLRRDPSFDARYPPHVRYEPASYEEEDGDWFEEEDFFYDSYGGEEPAFLPPKVGRDGGRAWDSSDGEEFADEDEERHFDEEDEEDSHSYAAEVHANMRQHGGRPMPSRGHPHHHHRGGMGRSGPPPLETPPTTPPPLARGDPLPQGMDPRMMRGRGMGPPMMDHGNGVRTVPVRGRPPRGYGMPMHREHEHMNRARFTASPSSSSGDGGPFHHGAARVRGTSGGSFKKAMRWLKPNGTPMKLNHSLRAGTLFNPVVPMSWNVSYPPVAVRAGVPVGFGKTKLSEPASSPPVSFMRLLVPIPGLDGDQWVVDVYPLGSPYDALHQIPPSPYPFPGTPNGVPMSSFPGHRPGFGPPTSFIRCADVLHALYTMLQRRAGADEFYALDARRSERVSRAFWIRCQATAASAAGNIGVGAPPPLHQQEMDRQVNSGIKRIDFMVGKTRWEGLEAGEVDDEWIVSLGHPGRTI